MRAMPVQALVVPRAEFPVEDPWAKPPQCTPFALRRATDGGAPRETAAVIAYHDGATLTVVFDCDDAELVATMYGHDEPLWREDVVEVFLEVDAGAYFEIEVNPLGTTFDARIESPAGIRATMVVDLDWTCQGLFAAVRRRPGRSEYVLRIPFAAIGGKPARANFFRVDRSATHGDEYSAWSPTMKDPADFHVAAAFGALELH